MINYLSTYSKENPEKFNNDFINLKQNDDALAYLNDICKALEVVDGIKFLDSNIITDESLIDINKKKIPVEESRLNLITFKFSITKDDETAIIETPNLYPKMINNFYLLSGSRYFPINQIIDTGTYHTRKTLVLKSLLMPINIKQESYKYKDIEGNEYISRYFVISLFKHRINVLNYYFAKKGFFETIKFMGLENEFEFLGKTDDKTPHEDYRFYKINENLYVKAKKDTGSQFKDDMLVGILQTLDSRSTLDKIDTKEYWIKRLGKTYTKNNNNNAQIEKAQKILVSFERILDDATKSKLRIDQMHKVDVYTLIRWMVYKYDRLMLVDNMDLKNKRVRLHEYLVYPLLRKFSNNTYRLLNNKTVSFKNLKTMFSTISPNFIIKKLVTNELLRYSNTVNTIDLYSSVLKGTYKGPQGLGEGKSNVDMRYRGLHGSYMGRIGLAAASASDPGMSLTFTPFNEMDGMYFATEKEYRLQFEDKDEVYPFE